jgi:hypothetical protein
MLLESSCRQLNYRFKIILKLTSKLVIGMKLGLAVPHMTVPTPLLAFGSARCQVAKRHVACIASQCSSVLFLIFTSIITFIL